MSQWNKMLKLAAKLAMEAGEKLLKEYRAFDRNQIKMKSEFEIVTQSDVDSEKLILHGIVKEFPQHGILSEETGAQNADADYLWVIDPVDGTTNFSTHNPFWSISIALAYKGEIKVGVIYAPVLGEMFTAIEGEPAGLNGRKMHVSDFAQEPLIHLSGPGNQPKDMPRYLKYFNHQKSQSFDCRQLGSAALELAYVACGRADSFVVAGAKPWDVAAGVLLVNQAAGKVTDLAGGLWDVKNPDLLASNGKIHVDLLKITAAL